MNTIKFNTSICCEYLPNSICICLPCLITFTAFTYYIVTTFCQVLSMALVLSCCCMFKTISHDKYLLDSYSDTVGNVFSNVAPSVVHILNKGKSINKRNGRSEEKQATGLGFIISSDGYVISR